MVILKASNLHNDAYLNIQTGNVSSQVTANSLLFHSQELAVTLKEVLVINHCFYEIIITLTYCIHPNSNIKQVTNASF